MRLAAAVALVAAAGAGIAVAFVPRGHAADAYGSIPSWLPKPKVAVGRVVVASRARPRLAIEGDEVSVRLPRGSVLATAVGPSVPETGRFPVPSTTPCTFTLTLRRLRGRVPVRAADFRLVDERGLQHRPHLELTGSTVTLRAVLPTGSGTLQWSPGGGAPVVSWDFDVEID